MRADQAHRDDIGRRHAALVLELEEVVLCVAFHVCLGPPDRSCDGRPVAAPGGRVLQRSQKLAVLLVRPLGSRCVLWHAPSRRLDSHETMWQKRRQRPTLLETRHAPSPRSLRPRFLVQLALHIQHSGHHDRFWQLPAGKSPRAGGAEGAKDAAGPARWQTARA